MKQSSIKKHHSDTAALYCRLSRDDNMDTESNSITSTMGRLYRTFKSNLLRYEDEPNEQVIETDIRQHLGSVKEGVHGINFSGSEKPEVEPLRLQHDRHHHGPDASRGDERDCCETD